MINTKKKFSAFKLFYDEFIYKENTAVSYDNIERNIEEIRDLTLEIRKTPKFDVKFYMEKLNRANKRLKKQLDAIYSVNNRFFEYYELLYKNHNFISTDKVQDMPFVISCSFYDDYRLDNKTSEELENSSVVVPKYSSLEKKNIRNEAKSLSRLEYFIKLLKDSKNNEIYKKFLNKCNYILRLKPFFNENHFNYTERIKIYLDEFRHLWLRLEEKAKGTEDYENISEMMSIAYKKRFTDWNEEIEKLISEYFDNLYNKMINDNVVRTKINVVNDISFETYMDSCDELIKEKESLFNEYNNDTFLTYEYDGDSYLLQLKKVLINAYFDCRYKNRLNDISSLDEYVDRALELYSLADELNDQIFEKIIFDASRSELFRRGNDARSALVSKVYELYNPLYLLTRYEETRVEFDKGLNKKDRTFKRDFNAKLMDKKKEFNYHGPIPTMKTIKTKITEKRKDFILKNCITELYSWNILGEYDTRNYDLNVIAKDISIDDFVNLYYRAKDKIEDYDFNFLDFANKGLVDKDYNKKKTLISLQEFVVKNLYSKLKGNASTKQEKENMYEDICNQYLKENIMFLDNKSDDGNSGDLDRFKEIRDNYIKASEWANLLTNNNMKNLL